MRLICPNCGAQYEVDDSVIPENGRDVQCSNCGHTWYQRAANSLAEEVSADTFEETPPVQEKIAEDDIPAPAEPDPEPVDEEVEPEGVEDTPEPEPVEPRRRELDEDVTSILQQEAEREVAERASEATENAPSQNVGLDDLDKESDDQIQRRMARLRGIDEDHGAAVAAAAIGAGQRKDLLPDIDELNSSLTASADGATDPDSDEAKEVRQRSGFRLGFVLTIAFFAVLALVYVFAPQIVDTVPALEGVLTGYVDWVNNLRLSVDATMQRVVARLTMLVSQIGGDAAL